VRPPADRYYQFTLFSHNPNHNHTLEAIVARVRDNFTAVRVEPVDGLSSLKNKTGIVLCEDMHAKEVDSAIRSSPQLALAIFSTAPSQLRPHFDRNPKMTVVSH
jgi:hypothetical protein